METVPLEQRVGKIGEALRNGGDDQELARNLVRQAARLVVEHLLEAEVGELLGRARYERRAGSVPPDAAEPASSQAQVPGGYRNGHKLRQLLRTGEGKVPIELPEVRGADGWSSPLWQALRRRTEVLD